jgi:hypothetical protein
MNIRFDIQCTYSALHHIIIIAYQWLLSCEISPVIIGVLSLVLTQLLCQRNHAVQIVTVQCQCNLQSIAWT